jgi:H+/Cl- antiporter ClcA
MWPLELNRTPRRILIGVLLGVVGPSVHFSSCCCSPHGYACSERHRPLSDNVSQSGPHDGYAAVTPQPLMDVGFHDARRPGLAAIFKSPFGSAIFAVEILYSRMAFEGGALIYTMILPSGT